MRNFSILLVLIMALSVGMIGCAKKSPMQNLGPAGINETVNLDESVIVFFVPANQLRLHIPIVETDEVGNLSLVTILVPGTKYLHRTTPGKHLYFLSTVRGRSEMLEANVEAGKAYYTYVSQHPDSRGSDPEYFHAFQFVPVSKITEESFREDFALCQWFKNARLTEEWFERNRPDLQKRYIEAQTRHKEAGSQKVIAPEYGTATLVQ